MFSPDRYVAALRFAAVRHGTQRVPDSELPYVVHLTSVAAEVIAADPADADLAVTCALLHDTIEDTANTPADKDRLEREIAAQFGDAVARGVRALTKDDTLDKADRMADSLRRIRTQPHAVWIVKLADRITNLAPPPRFWKPEKIAAYRAEAQAILDALGEASEVLAARLRAKIAAYPPA